MRTTKFLNYLKNNYVEIIFFVTIFFTSCLFMDTKVHCEFFRNKAFFYLFLGFAKIKLILSLVLPFFATLLAYKKFKHLVRIADLTAVIMCIYSIWFVLDVCFFKVFARIEKAIVIYHLGYALITYFVVFLTVTALELLKKQSDREYGAFCHAFFFSFSMIIALAMFYIYFVNRDYGFAEKYSVNLVPFQGEFREMLDTKNQIIIIRNMGNVCLFTALAILIAEMSNKHKAILGMLIPTAICTFMEAFQYFAVCGDTDIDDVIANVVGSAAGILFYKLIIERIKEKSKC